MFEKHIVNKVKVPQTWRRYLPFIQLTEDQFPNYIKNSGKSIRKNEQQKNGQQI